MDPTQPPTVVMMALPVQPPVTPGMLPARRSSWPTAIGVIAVAFGALGALGGLFGIVGQFLVGAIPKMSSQQDQVFAVIATWRPWLIAISAATFAVAVLLLFGGVVLMNRRRPARSLILAWSMAKIALVAVSCVINYQVNQHQFTAMQQTGMNQASMHTAMSIAGTVGIVLSLLWGCALPVFMIIWFMRPGVVREMNQWG